MSPVTRVLLVDPDPASRRLLSDLLGGTGLTVATADSGPVALMRLAESAPDVVVLDYARADLLAEKIVRTIRLKHPRVPLILLVNELQPRQRAALNALGVRACMPKEEAPQALPPMLSSLGESELPALVPEDAAAAAPQRVARASPRVRAELRAEVEVEGRNGGAVHRTHDVSEGGVFLQTHDPPAVGTRVRLRLALPDGTTTPIEGQVAHVVSPGHATSQRPAGVGVRFTDVDEAQRAHLSRVTEAAARKARETPAPVLPALPLDDDEAPATSLPSLPAETASAPPAAERPTPRRTSGSSRAVTLRALLDDLKEQDLFAALGVRRDATTAEIERAFEDAARLWHPARFAFDGGEVRGIVRELFLTIAEAREVLVNPARNRAYRDSLPAQPQRPTMLDADALFGDLVSLDEIAPRPEAQPGTLERAAAALRDGDFERASALYQAQLATKPDDEQAIAGLRAVGERKRDARRDVFGKLLKGEKP